MKTIAALIAGLLLSITTFIAGLLSALIYFEAGEAQHRSERLDSAALWTSEPLTVDRNPQSFERLPARSVHEERQVAGLNKAAINATPRDAATPSADPAAEDPLVILDPVTTGAIDPLQSETEASHRAKQNMAHIEWCSRRYRSYRAENNTYQPYSGGRRSCESPYSSITAAELERGRALNGSDAVAQQSRNGINANQGEVQLKQASFEEEPDAYATSDHVRSCLLRYRSYRQEDNTYQPFDGGPREKCR